MTIDIHFSISANYWVCTTYWYSNDLSKYYDLPNPDGMQSHGYLSGANGDVPFVACTSDDPTRSPNSSRVSQPTSIPPCSHQIASSHLTTDTRTSTLAERRWHAQVMRPVGAIRRLSCISRSRIVPGLALSISHHTTRPAISTSRI